MLDVCLLGTGGMLPLPGRWLTSLFLKYNGSGLLIDCGEATQIAMKEAGISNYDIDTICFTHFHADHISGLPGMLLSMGNSGRTTPVTLIGPKGLKRIVTALRTIAPELPFEIEFIELDDAQSHLSRLGYEIDIYKLNHKVTCFGYTISIPRMGKFNVEKANSLGIPKMFWNKLQHGEDVVVDGVEIKSESVMGNPRKGIKVTYCTDTRPVQAIIDNAYQSDLFICEGMYGTDDRLNKAREYKHMTFSEAATLAKEADVKEMWLTHFSPVLQRPGDFINIARKIFANSHVGSCGKAVTLMYED